MGISNTSESGEKDPEKWRFVDQRPVLVYPRLFTVLKCALSFVSNEE